MSLKTKEDLVHFQREVVPFLAAQCEAGNLEKRVDNELELPETFSMRDLIGQKLLVTFDGPGESESSSEPSSSEADDGGQGEEEEPEREGTDDDELQTGGRENISDAVLSELEEEAEEDELEDDTVDSVGPDQWENWKIDDVSSCTLSMASPLLT